MPKIEVRVFRKGQEVVTVRRPLRRIEGKPAVRYKKRLWPLIDGANIYLDNVPPSDDAQIVEAADTEDSAPPEFHAVPPALIEWDRSQRKVIAAAQGERLLVGAGPGTGKTAVACARVSQLIDRDGVEPSRIWLISFTRTAVNEIRDRVAAYLEDASSAYAVKVATLDSHAWTIHTGFDDAAKILDSYEENIERVLTLVRSDESVAEYLECIEHVVVDEAQDIVGIRADLVVEFIHKLSSACGVTVFADEAQAIYSFADDRETPVAKIPVRSFSERIRSGCAGVFRECELTHVHRTSSSRLLRIFSDTRRKVLTVGGGTSEKLDEIKDDIISLSHGEAPWIDAMSLAELEDAFILYRRRCDVLLASSILAQDGIAHRVRMSGLPACLTPWVGAVLADYLGSNLTRGTFEELWSDRVPRTLLVHGDLDVAWTSLVRLAGRTSSVVDMRLLRQRLGRKQPPTELCHGELGIRGPIVGTIHASKGREAHTVHLMLPHTHSRNTDQDEEARVVFVGATRGRARLLVGRGYHQAVSRVDASGRAYSLKTRQGRPRAQVEIGRDTDVNVEGLAGRRFFPDAAAVRTSQSRIINIADGSVPLVAECDRESGFAYRLREDGQGQCLAVLSQSVNSDLFAIADAVQAELGGSRRRPPDAIRHLHMAGVRTVVLPADSLDCEALHEPWRSTGIMLAPLILGYSTVYFPYRSGNRRWKRARSTA